ncbi:MAG: hypothetical protein JNJ54_25820 [Myxococcaceae bacterium]|nr:hypothetical protein [Myxococcaceae bacterium]
MLSPQPAPAGAMCAVHTDVAADSVCSRCGNFMCATCSDRRTGTLCPTCRQALGTFPFNRQNYDFSGVWNYVFEAWRRDLVMLGVGGGVMMGLGFIGNVVMQVFQLVGQAVLVGGGRDKLVAGGIVMGIGMLAGLGVTILVQGIGIMGLIRLCIDSLHGRKVEIPRMFTQAKKVWRYAVVQLAIMFTVTVPLLLGGGLIFALAVLVGGGGFSAGGIKEAFSGPAAIGVVLVGSAGLTFALVWLVLPLTFAQFEIVYGGCEAIEAIRRGWILGTDHRLPTLGYSLVAMAAVMALSIAGLLALCVGVMIAVPIGYALFFMLQAGLYLSLRNGSELPRPVES